MQQKYGFTSLAPGAFSTWIKEQQVARTILYLQQHHTYLPAYEHFTGFNHFELQRSMQRVHRAHNGWTDIAQHFTIFPDGQILTGRSLERTPAGIYGFNAHAICIENLGNFDLGGDLMRQEQRDAIVMGAAALAQRFGIPVDTERMVYHHWFDLATGFRTNQNGRTKSCPGTAFFGGNREGDAARYFFPQIAKVLEPQQGSAAVKPMHYGVVKATALNVRNSPTRAGKKVNQVEYGTILRIYELKNGWYRISARGGEWCYGAYIDRVERGTVRVKRLNVRSGPGSNYRLLGHVSMGEVVFIWERKGNWYRISADLSKWVSGRYLALV